MQHVVSRAVRDIDTNTVREREKSIALWARPASGQHHFLLFSILAGNGVCILENTGKTEALTRRTFVCKVMFLLFKTLSTFVIVFLPRSKCLLISWLQLPSAVTLEPQEIKSDTISTVSHLFPMK